MKNIIMFILLFIFLILNLSVIHASEECEEFQFYHKEFEDILNNMIKNFWQEDGNWGGDMMGDANWFASALLFPLGKERDREDFINMAIKTVEYQKRLFEEFISKFNKLKIPDNMVETVGGMPAIFYGYKYTRRSDLEEEAKQAIELIYKFSKNPPDLILKIPGMDPVVMIAAASYSAYSLYQETGEEKYKKYAIDLIKIADIVYWDEEEKYYGELWDWAECSMLLALSGVYQLTKDETYYERAKILLSTILEKMWDEEKGGLITPKHFNLRKAKLLSGNNIFITALIEWYKVKKDKIFLDYAKKTLNFILSPNLFEKNIIYHHWTEDEGRAKEYCTGCNFHTLWNIHQFNNILRKTE